VRVVVSTKKSASGMDKFGSVIYRTYMKLGSKYRSSLRAKTQLLNRLQCVIVVDAATHSQKDGVEGDRGSLMDVANAFVLFPHLLRNFLTFCSSADFCQRVDEGFFVLFHTCYAAS